MSFWLSFPKGYFSPSTSVVFPEDQVTGTLSRSTGKYIISLAFKAVCPLSYCEIHSLKGNA